MGKDLSGPVGWPGRARRREGVVSRRAVFFIASAWSLCLAGGAVAAPQGPPAKTLEFKGSELGMSLADWKAAPFPGRAADPVSTICSDDPASAASGLTATPAQTQRGEIVCTYISKGLAGDASWEAVPISDHLLAYHVLYSFRSGRLTGISYQTSTDAFDDVVARIKAQLGPSSDVERDVVHTRWGAGLPRVKMVWRTPTASAQLVDPTTRPDRLSVTLRSGAG